LLKKYKIDKDDSDIVVKIKNKQSYTRNERYDIIIYECKRMIASKLAELEDDISMYNLSFFLQKDDAIKTLQKIKHENTHAQIHLAFLQKDQPALHALKNTNAELFTFYNAYYLFLSNKLQTFEHKPTKNKTLQPFATIYDINLQITSYCKSKNEMTLLKAKKACISAIMYNKKCFYLTFYYAYINYAEKNYAVAIKTLEFFLNETKMCKNVEIRAVQHASYFLLALCHLQLGNTNAGVTFSKNVDYMQNTRYLLNMMYDK